jgi:lysyl-tRNA synthetase class 2
MAEKARLYGERYPIDASPLVALTQVPPASGAAPGFFRLVMLATGTNRVEDARVSFGRRWADYSCRQI